MVQSKGERKRDKAGAVERGENGHRAGRHFAFVINYKKFVLITKVLGFM